MGRDVRRIAPSASAAGAVLVTALLTGAVAQAGPAGAVARPAADRAAALVELAPTAAARLAQAQVDAVPAPRLRWQPCLGGPRGVECARAVVPTDYADPSAGGIQLALARVRTTDRNRIGSLFVNPGGPGGSAVELVKDLGPGVVAAVGGRFDVVGVDPRGVAGSNPVHCFRSDRQEREFFAQNPDFPYREYQELPFFEANREVGNRCRRLNPRIAAHMSTADVARDMDLLRRSVGDPKLSYLGFSYGSYLGTTYANLFPARVRALVVDGVLDPRTWSGRSNLRYDKVGADRTFAEFLRLCDAAGRPACAFAGGDPAKRFAALAARLRAAPLVVPGIGKVTYDLLLVTLLGALYDTGGWRDAAEGIEAVAEGAPDRVRAAFERLGVGAGRAEDNSLDAYFGNRCADSTLPRGFAAWQRVGEATARVSLFGPGWWWFDAPCSVIPPNAGRYAGPWDARTSAPVLVIGNRFDPATDYHGAVEVAGLLPRGRLLTYAGWGHTGYGKPCVRAYVNAYLADGTLPAAGTVCPAEPNPFLSAANHTPAERSSWVGAPRPVPRPG